MSRDCQTIRVVCPCCETPQGVDCFRVVDHDELVGCVSCAGRFVISFRVVVTAPDPIVLGGEMQRVEARLEQMAGIRQRFAESRNETIGERTETPDPDFETIGAVDETAASENPVDSQGFSAARPPPVPVDMPAIALPGPARKPRNRFIGGPPLRQKRRDGDD